MSRDALDVRPAYLTLGMQVVTLITQPSVTRLWTRPSVLPDMSVGALAGHTARALLIVEEFLEGPDPVAPDPVDASAYYARVRGLADRTSEANRGILERAVTRASEGPASLVLRVTDCLERLAGRLATESPQRQIVARGDAMFLDEYLRTRLVEMSVHLEDLALSAELTPPEIVETVLVDAVAVLLGTARARHGQAAVLRALTRRERDTVDALRVI